MRNMSSNKDPRGRELALALQPLQPK
jgi:hypothetical protein